MMKNFHDLKKLKNFNLIDFAVPIIDYLCPIKYSPNQKYDNRYFLTCILHFIETSVSWNKYKGTPEYPIDGKYLNQIHNRYERNNVYSEIEKQIRDKYLKTDREAKLKCQIIDSSFIGNKQGSVKNNDHLLTAKEKTQNRTIRRKNKHSRRRNTKRERKFIDFNRYNGRKKYFHISVITDAYGRPLESSIFSAKRSDSTTLIENVNNLPNLNTLQNSKINRYKQYFLADSGYDTKINKKFLLEKGYTPIVKYNKRNCKNKETIRQNTLKGKHKQIYKKRPIVESFFAWIKNKPVINQNYQKRIESYKGLFSLACSIVISNGI